MIERPTIQMKRGMSLIGTWYIAHEDKENGYQENFIYHNLSFTKFSFKLGEAERCGSKHHIDFEIVNTINYFKKLNVRRI